MGQYDRSLNGILSLLPLLILVGCGSPSYDLKCTPSQGDIHRSVFSMKMDEGRVIVQAGVDRREGTAKLSNRLITEMDFLEVSAGEPQRLKVSHLDAEDVSQIYLQGELVEDRVDTNPLLGRSILFTQARDSWSKRLVGGDPMAEHLEAIENYGNPWNDELWSHGKLRVGDSWTVGGEKLAEIVGASIQNIHGQMRCQFERIADYNGESCALISVQIDMTAGLPDGLHGTTSLSGEGHIYGSLARRIDVFTRLTGVLEIRVEETSEGQSIKTTIQGPVVLEETVTVD